MPNVPLIISTLDKYLVQHQNPYLTAVEAAAILDRLGILKDSTTRRGLPLRNLLRADALPHAYQVGVYWHIPQSGIKGKPILDEVAGKIQSKEIGSLNPGKHKLEPIAQALSQYLEGKFKKPATYTMEYAPQWLTSVPDKAMLNEDWPLVKKVYASLVDGRYDLDEQLKLIQKKGKQYFDIWFDDPYFFAVEFDEEQHFNQFRARTLNFYGDLECGINIQEYRTYCGVDKKPGTSGFHKLKSPDPLFPPMLEGEKQDNRMRQRAFKDFLKDIVPVANEFCPTIRIPFQLVNSKKSDFNKIDLQQIVDYVNKNNFIS